MRKLSFLLMAGALFLGISCTPDIEDLYKRVDALEKQVAELSALNSTVSGLSTAVEALQDNVYVKSVTETADGYVIEFTNGKTATIKDGEPGQDATAPTVGVKEVNGELVWTVNDQVVKDASGNPVPATVKVPEFKFDNNKWWYRFGANDTWKDCGEKTGPEPSITETEEFVIITIGDKSVQIPKELVSPAIKAIKPVLNKAPNLFVPVGESINLKDFFTVEPEGALKSMVEYVPAEGSPITVTDKGILTTTADCNSSVDLVSKSNPDIKLNILIRSAVCPDNETPTTTIDPEQKIMIFEGSMEEYISATDLGGSSNFNPINNSHTAAFKSAGGAFNFRLRLPVIQNTNLTMENARLHMWFYISDASVLQSAPFDGEHFLEVSSLRYDQQEVNFELPLFVPDLKTGWNEIDLPFTVANNPNNAEGPFDITKVCAIRFVCHADTKDKWEAIQIRDLFAYAADASITAINPVLAKQPNLFVPVGESVDLKDFFTVEPEGALKSMVEYVPAEGSPITVTDKGILTTTADCNSSVDLVSKSNPDIKLNILIRSAVCPDNETPTTTIDPEQKIMIFEGSMEEYISATDLGGSSNFNPINNSHTAAFKSAGGAFNFRLRLPVIQNTNLTMENARLHMWFYISDASVLQSAPFDGEHFLEVSSLRYDQQEVNFELPLFVPDLKTGWNEIDLPFTVANNPNNAEGPFDITKVCAIRFVCHADTHDKYEVIQVKDLFAYVPDAPVQITIDGDLSDWAKVKGVTNTNDGATYLEFKMASDADNIYFYTKRVPNTALWNGGGYLYYGLDYDNDTTTGGGEIWGNGPYECIFVIWPFAGSGDAPAFAEKPLGDSMIKPSGSLAHYNANGKADATGVELEFSIPRADLPELPATQISVYAWGNKSGENMKNFPLKVTL